MNIQIMNSVEFLRLRTDFDFVAIRYKATTINYFPDEVLPHYCIDYLGLIIDDLQEEQVSVYEEILSITKNPTLPIPIWFKKEDAKKIIDFVKKWGEKVDTLICACDGGVSRSAATAAAISKVLFNDDMWVFNSYKYRPNTLIYSLIIKTWMEEESANLSEITV